MMPKQFAFKDETGQQYGLWVVESRASNADGNACWHCYCVLCGARRIIQGIKLRSLPPPCPCEDREPI